MVIKINIKNQNSTNDSVSNIIKPKKKKSTKSNKNKQNTKNNKSKKKLLQRTLNVIKINPENKSYTSG